MPSFRRFSRPAGTRAAAVILGILAVAAAAARLPAAESDLLRNPRQLTLDGRRSGEGYFSADGRKLVFQSEREPGNPFYQIYLMDLETGDTTRVSPGVGKTTCAWIHPDGQTILFASTHEDNTAREKQEGELKERASGTQRRYAWDYDDTFELYATTTQPSETPPPLRRLTDTRGYDAEGAFSPDGRFIVFASNRDAYSRELTAGEKERLEIDKQFFCDIYIMNADGTGVRRLTDAPGYDGGPFFSADGSRICWRRFDDKGERAEIWTMKTDGTDQRQITRLGAMSWAPFFHPSGEYLVFSTNLQGFDNFELYMVDAEGRHDPVRVTDTPGFDGLPSFSPDGTTIAWTSTRTAEKTSQIFLADWNHQAARRALFGEGTTPAPAATTPAPATTLAAAITAEDMKVHVTTLASEAMEGRLPGTRGEQLATDYAAQTLASFGLEPAGDGGSWFQPFEFTAGVELGADNALAASKSDAAAPAPAAPVVDTDWRPLSFSTVGRTEALPVVFAGYGIELSDDGPDAPAYSSYFHLDVKDKWVMVLRYQPEGIPQNQRGRFIQASSLRFKAMTARQRGARGLIVVSGPNSKVREQLVPLTFDASLAGSGLAAVSVTDALAKSWLALAGQDLQALHNELDQGQPVAGFEIKGLSLAATIDLKQEKRTGRNVLARLPATVPASTPAPAPALLICAHIDHLGREFGGSSRATDTEKGLIHFGADDNASGSAGTLEIAQWLATEKSSGRLELQRDVLIALWSGEEAGLLGSTHFAKSLARETKGEDGAKLDGVLAACLNLDMIGRLEKSLVLQGLGSSDWWKPQIEKRNVPVGLPLTLQSDCYAPTDTTSFYPRGVPILNAFTGNHDDYHRPTDTADKINYEGAAKVARLMGLIARDLATTADAPAWKEYQTGGQPGQRAAMRAYLGTVPDYSQGDEPGVKLSGVSPVGPAAKAGVRGGDIIVGLGGKDILNIYDYTAILGELKVNTETEIIVKRSGSRVTLKITPTSRD